MGGVSLGGVSYRHQGFFERMLRKLDCWLYGHLWGSCEEGCGGVHCWWCDKHRQRRR